MIIKNSNLRRQIVSNRYLILVIIIAIILLFALINVLKQMAKSSVKQEENIVQNTVITNQEKYTSQQTIISGTNVTKNEQENNTKIIEQFIQYCNNKEIEKAYNLITDECKEEIFSSNIQNFSKNYVDKVFTTKKTCSMQSWINTYLYTTYKVKISNDILSTGKLTSTQDEIEDYYTIIKKDNEYKLNINNYILREDIDIEKQINGIKVTVICKDIYKEYESYDIKIENITNNTIMLDSQENINSMYIVASNENKYSAFSYEIDKTNLIIEPDKSKTITIHFNKVYSNKAVTRKLVFEDIITNYDEYKEMKNKKEYKSRRVISIEV